MGNKNVSMSVSLGVVILVLLGIVVGDKCADECTCKWKSGKRTVECVNRSLSSIPDKIDQDTQVLDASGNDIRILPSNIFKRVSLTNLQRLYLRNCRMQQIDNDAFGGLTNLIELDLSFNRLINIPSNSFIKAPFLRDLSLSNNPLEIIVSDAFLNSQNLVKLDLSYTKIHEVESNGFRGLTILETLKLNNNQIETFHPGTFDSLIKLTSIELHDNPWICNCHLREMKMWLVKHNLPTLISPICHGPEQLLNKKFNELIIDDFACRPVLMIASRYAEATIGENASIVCRVSAVPQAKIKWFWNGKLLTNHSSFNTYQKIIILEEGQFSKRSTLILTNAQESDSSEFYCVAENRAGSVEANFTLHVSLRTAGMSTLGSGQIAGISAALVVLILLILLTILILFVRLRRMPLKDVKTSTIEVVPIDSTNTIDDGQINDVNQQQQANHIHHQQQQQQQVNHHQQQQFNHKIYEAETTFNNDTKPVTLNLNYVQRQQVDNNDYIFDESQPVIHGPCFSSTASLVPIDNPDLIRDTRGTSIEEIGTYNDHQLNSLMMEETRLLYSSIWDDNSTRNIDNNKTTINKTISNKNNPSNYVTNDILPSTIEQQHQQHQQQNQQQQFPPGAKQLRVWQKGVPVLPPVSALKRVLGSTRSSPDEGYQEGTGTDV
ncbi:leucine-rich repeat-containing protein 24-like [Aphidius gifuensis]|uniref:leucine-rich repeat-containing protein 24-like n=1 Tax=Aphidius gifuensis TaxID=684658 RepID=UPI001CDC4FA6|nr:leucine-rich repeat-containing protein 24-like [Aphidius gifuensis]